MLSINHPVHLIHGTRQTSGNVVAVSRHVVTVQQKGYASRITFMPAKGLYRYKDLLLTDAKGCTCPNCWGLRRTAGPLTDDRLLGAKDAE